MPSSASRQLIVVLVVIMLVSIIIGVIMSFAPQKRSDYQEHFDNMMAAGVMLAAPVLSVIDKKRR